jgi:hypothetical protein
VGARNLPDGEEAEAGARSVIAASETTERLEEHPVAARPSTTTCTPACASPCSIAFMTRFCTTCPSRSGSQNINRPDENLLDYTFRMSFVVQKP